MDLIQNKILCHISIYCSAKDLTLSVFNMDRTTEMVSDIMEGQDNL